MRRPFCAEEILDEASVCRYCGNDLRIPKTIKTENEELKRQVVDLQTEFDGLRAAQAKRRKNRNKASPSPTR